MTIVDGSLAYETRGTGLPALVFIHGWACDRAHWQGQMAAFAPSFQVVAIDLGGHGASRVNRDVWTIESFGADVAAVVKRLGLTRTILIGHSMGGDVSVAAARLLPGLVEGIVWVDNYKRLGTVRTEAQLRAILAPLDVDFAAVTLARVREMFPAGTDPALVERVATAIAAAAPDIARPTLASSLAYAGEVTVALQTLRLPVVAINSAEPATDLASMTRYCVEVVTMEGVGHFPMLEKPDAFNAVLASVLARFR